LFQPILERHTILNFLRSFQALNIFLSIHILCSVYISIKNYLSYGLIPGSFVRGGCFLPLYTAFRKIEYRLSC
jgi:hypothetical protein